MFILSSIRSNKFCNQENDEVDEFVSKYVLGQNSDRNIGIYKGALNSLVQKSNISQYGSSDSVGKPDEDDFDNTFNQKKESKDKDENNANKDDSNEADIDIDDIKQDENIKDEDDNSSIESSSSTSEEENDKDDFEEYKDEENNEDDNVNGMKDDDGNEMKDDDGNEMRDDDENENEVKDRIQNQSFMENNIPSINLKILAKPLLRHVTDIDINKKTNILKISISWPVKLCPHYIDFLPVLKNTISKVNIQSISNLKNARITRNQRKVDDDQLSQFELTVEGTNVGHIHRISPKYIKHDRIRFNDIQTVYKYYGVEAARQCIINELRNVFSVYGINVDYRHLTLISDSITSSGQLRVFNRMGAISHNISPFLQMSFETSMKFLTEACLRKAVDNLKSPASSISVGKIVNVGTGISRTYTNFYQFNCNSNLKDKKEHKKDDNYFKFL